MGDDATRAGTFGTLLWVSSAYYYKMKFQGPDKNLVNLALFTFASYYASYGYAYFLFQKPTTGAAIINNHREINH